MKTATRTLITGLRDVLPLADDLADFRRHVLENPYYFRFAIAGRRRLTQRAVLIFLASLIAFFISLALLADRSALGAPIGTFVLGWLVFRAVMILRAAWAVSAFAAREIRDGVLQEVHLTRMRSGEIANGWAIAGWLRAAPETFLALAAFYPWLARSGAWSALLPLLGIVSTWIYQAHAAVAAGQMRLDHPQRREAVAAGWILGTFVIPCWVWAGVLGVGLVMLLPAVLAIQLAALVGALMRPLLEISYLVDLPMWDLLATVAHIYALLGAFVVHPIVNLVLLVRMLNNNEDAPLRPGGYFESQSHS